MSQQTLSLTPEVHRYLLDHSLCEPAVLAQLRATTAAMPEANMQLAPEQGQLLQWLVRAGGIICVDNTLWSGDVARPEVNDANTQAIRAFNDHVHRDTRVDLSLVPIGDGLTLLRKRGQPLRDAIGRRLATKAKPAAPCGTALCGPC